MSEESKTIMEKEAKVTQNVVPIPRPPPLCLQKLAKIEEGKYCGFINMLKKLSTNVHLIEVSQQIPGYPKS